MSAISSGLSPVPRDANGFIDMAALATRADGEASVLRAEIAARRAQRRGTLRLERKLALVEMDARAFRNEARS